MELKLIKIFYSKKMAICFNRTFMELKLSKNFNYNLIYIKF